MDVNMLKKVSILSLLLGLSLPIFSFHRFAIGTDHWPKHSKLTTLYPSYFPSNSLINQEELIKSGEQFCKKAQQKITVEKIEAFTVKPIVGKPLDPLCEKYSLKPFCHTQSIIYRLILNSRLKHEVLCLYTPKNNAHIMGCSKDLKDIPFFVEHTPHSQYNFIGNLMDKPINY